MRFVRTLLAAFVALFALIGGLLVAAVIAMVGLLLMLFGRATGRVRMTTGRRFSAGRPQADPSPAPARASQGDPVIDVVATEVIERR